MTNNTWESAMSNLSFSVPDMRNAVWSIFSTRFSFEWLPRITNYSKKCWCLTISLVLLLMQLAYEKGLFPASLVNLCSTNRKYPYGICQYIMDRWHDETGVPDRHLDRVNTAEKIKACALWVQTGWVFYLSICLSLVAKSIHRKWDGMVSHIIKIVAMIIIMITVKIMIMMIIVIIKK